MARENSLWGAPRIHGEVLKLGLDVSQATVAKYMARPRTPPSQSWRTFLTNHLQPIAAADFFVVATATCRPCLYSSSWRTSAAVSCTSRSPTNPPRHGRRNNSAEAFPWNEAPRFLVHDRDSAFYAWDDDRVGDRHRGNCHGSAVTLAERLRGALDRIHSPRVPRSHHHHERARIAPRLGRIPRVLPEMADPLVARQGCAGGSTHRDTDRRRDCRDSSPRRSPPSLRTTGRVTATRRQYDPFRRHRERQLHVDRLSVALPACDEYGLRTPPTAIRQMDEVHSEGEPA